jgi:hypothetical protein
MRYLIISIFCFFSFQSVVFSQVKEFKNKIGYFDYEAMPTLQLVDSTGNHYVLGQFTGLMTVLENTVETRGDKDIYIIKYDSLNNFQWIRTFGSPGQDFARSMSCDKDGNIYVTGQYLGSTFYASENITLNTLTQYQQSRFLIKINTLGETRWARKFSGTNASSDQKAEVFNDHDGRLYLIHTNRANGALSSWNYSDSIIANPANQHLNVPRWVMARINPNNGSMMWLDYIANPSVGGNVVTFMNVSRPVVDSKNDILFAVSHSGNHVTPIYIFGQYAALNPNVNNILVKIDSLGQVKRFRDLGAGNTSKSDITDLAVSVSDEPILINKKAFINNDGFSKDYWNNNNFNYARIYDTNFILKRIVKLGTQLISSYLIDKENRLNTISNMPLSSSGVIGGTESVNSDSITISSVLMKNSVVPYFIRYNQNYGLDTFFTDSKLLPFGGFQLQHNSLLTSSKGDLLLLANQGIVNNSVFRYTKNFIPKNINYGKVRDLPEAIIDLGEDSSKSIYVGGHIHMQSDFTTSKGNVAYNNSIDRGVDAFIAKYNSDNSLAWVRRIGKSSNESPIAFKVGRDGLYLVASSSLNEDWRFDSTNTYFSGKTVVVKLDFQGNLVWTREIASNTGIELISLSVLKNGKILISGSVTGAASIAGQNIAALGTKKNLLLSVLDNTDGSLLKHNVFALSNQTLSAPTNFSRSIHEDNQGNLYLGVYATIFNVNAPSTRTELFSLKSTRIPFTHNWLDQTGIIKLDSTLEIKKFNTFRSYFKFGNIGGIDSTILFTAYGRGASFNYDTITGMRVVPLHNYATDSHFTNFTGKIDNNLNILELSKFDTTSIESSIDIMSRKIVTDTYRDEIYETCAFSTTIKIDSTDNSISAIGSRDLLFLKYDKRGKLMGGQRLGTPQTDFFTTAAASSGGLIFSTQTVNPQYQSQFLKMNNVYKFIESAPKSYLTGAPITIHGGTVALLSTDSSTVRNLDVLSPDNYISRNLSLSEIGRNPDTTILNRGELNLCSGSSSFLVVNSNNSNISWSKNGLLISGQVNDTLLINESGIYKAIVRTAEGRVDSTREYNFNFYQIPSAPVTTASSVCEGGAVSALTATASTGNSLRWYGTSVTGGTASTSAPTASSSAAGVTNYYVSQVSAQGCESDRSVLVFTVHPKPSAPVTTASSVCEGGSVSVLTATASTGNSLRWYGTSVTGGTASTSAPTASSSAAGVTNYYVSQVSAQGCESDRSVLAYTVHPKPSAPVTTASSVCEGGSVSALTATASTGNSLRWYGTSVTGGTASTSAPTASSSAAGVTNYYVSQVSAQGCESDRSVLAYTVHPKPSAPVTTASSVCEGGSVSALAATASTGNSLRWYGANATGGTASTSAPTASSSTAGVTNYYVSQVSAQGCESDRSVLVFTIHPKPSAPVTTASSVCIGGSVSALTATASNGNSLRWYGTSATGGTASTSAPTASSSTAGATNYYVSQVSAQGCESDRGLLKHTVNPLPAKPVISWSGVQFSTTATGVNYQWLLNGASISGATASTHKPLNTGDFKLRVTDPNGCVNVSDSFKLVVTALANLATTPASNIATVYPNPASDKVVLEFAALPTINLNFQLVTPSGKVLSSTTGRNKVNIIDVSDIQSGNYFIRVIGKKYDQVKKVLIQK